MQAIAKNILSLRFLLLALSVLVHPTLCAEELSREYNVKVAFIYNFTKFVEWSPQYLNPDYFDICLLGDDRLNEAVVALENKQIDGRRLRINKIERVEKNSTCNIIFFAISNVERLQQAIESARDINALTIGDEIHFIDHGGIIGLVLEGNQVKFEINFARANEKGLKINSHLLGLASRVIHTSQENHR